MKGMLSCIDNILMLIQNAINLHRIDIKIVPILVGAIGAQKENSFGKILAPYLAKDDTFCVVSSDFCHW